MLRGSQAVVARNNLEFREICAVAAIVEYQHQAGAMQWSLAERSGFLVLSVQAGKEKGDVALAAAQMTTNRHTYSRAVGMGDTRYIMHCFRMGGAASYYMEGTVMDVLVEYVGWKSATVARIHVGGATPAAAAGVERSSETAFTEADGLPLSNLFTRSYTAPRRVNLSRTHRRPS